MKKPSILIIIGLLSFAVSAQNIDRYVVNTSSNSVALASFSIDYSIGETAVSSLGGISNILTQGFIQPETQISTNVHALNIDYAFLQCYPNPVSEILTIVFPQSISGNYTIDVYEMNGQKIVSQPIFIQENIKEVSIDLSMLSTGVYFIKASSYKEKVGMLKVLKIK